MNRYVLTGAPGAGKTAVIRQLECEGFGVVEEAATDIIALWQAKGIAEPSGLPPFRERRERNLRKETSSKEILLVDDEDNIRLTLSLILRERGFTVTAAGSVLDAKRILKVQDFD